MLAFSRAWGPVTWSTFGEKQASGLGLVAHHKLVENIIILKSKALCKCYSPTQLVRNCFIIA